MNKNSKAYMLGFVIGATGGDKSKCPYEIGFYNFTLWQEGYKDAQEWWWEET